MMLRSACLLSAPRVGVLVVCLAIGPLAACKKAEQPAKPAAAAAAKPKAAFRVKSESFGSRRLIVRVWSCRALPATSLISGCR